MLSARSSRIVTAGTKIKSSKGDPPLRNSAKRLWILRISPILIVAEKEGRTSDIEGLVKNITRQGWWEHLANLRATDTRAFFNYLAKAEGRLPSARGFSRNAPLIDSQGNRKFDALTECELLAEHFGGKLNMPGLNGTSR